MRFSFTQRIFQIVPIRAVRHPRSLLTAVLAALILSSCAAPTQNFPEPFTPTASLPSPSATPFQPTPTSAPTRTPDPPTLWIDSELPEHLAEAVIIPESYLTADSRSAADVNMGLEGDTLLGYWTLTLAVRFDSLEEDRKISQLKALWSGRENGGQDPYQLYLDPETHQLLSAVWGPPDDQTVKVIPSGSDLLEVADRPDFLTILPFQDLSPELKVLAVNGQKPLWPEFSPSDHPLAIPLYLSGSQEAVQDVLEANPGWGNLQRDQLTRLAMTGVTALVRATAWTMEQEGILYPALDIKPIFDRADLTHISNEVPFDEDCPAPDLDQPHLYFCSADRYLELLEYIGTDIVELTGDHFGDRGPQAMLHTLDLYEKQGWATYGGGRNLQAGLQPITFSHHGNKLAFIGCNAKGGKYATAADQKPGSAACDFDWMTDEISRLSEQGYLVIATMQHDEYYSFQANYLQIRDFRNLAEAGAAVVSGSQAHQPQTLEFHSGAFIHYGLGNLFFDQFRVAKYVEQFKDTDRAFIDLHYFYRGRHISTELYTIKFIDYARSRRMTPEERRDLLEAVFDAQPR